MTRNFTFMVLLGSTGADEQLESALSELPADKLTFGHSWLVRTEMTADEVRDYLRDRTEKVGKILVVQTGQQGAWHGFNAIDTDWLLERL